MGMRAPTTHPVWFSASVGGAPGPSVRARTRTRANVNARPRPTLGRSHRLPHLCHGHFLRLLTLSCASSPAAFRCPGLLMARGPRRNCCAWRRTRESCRNTSAGWEQELVSRVLPTTPLAWWQPASGPRAGGSQSPPRSWKRLLVLLWVRARKWPKR